MKSFILSAVSILAAVVLLLTATISFVSICAEDVYADTDAEEQAPDDLSYTGTEDVISFDADPDLNLKGENDPSPEDDPQAPINQWPGLAKSNTSKITFLKNASGKRYEYRKLAGQKMYGYDTFQGSCLYGKYAYYVLYNRINQKCKIAKVDFETHKVVKVSKALPLDHGNDITYDSTRDRLVVVHYGAHIRRLSVIDPVSLKRLSYVDIKKPTKRLPGASTAFSKSISGVTGIAYDEEHDEFVCSIQGTRHYMILDSNFKPQSVVKVPENKPYVRQGMTVIDGFIIRSFSAYNKKYNQNILYVYDMSGNFVKTVKLGRGYEIESIFFKGKKLYATTYTSYYKKIRKTVKKYVTVRTKSGRYVRKRKKVKVTVYRLRRDNNVMRIKEY